MNLYVSTGQIPWSLCILWGFSPSLLSFPLKMVLLDIAMDFHFPFGSSLVSVSNLLKRWVERKLSCLLLYCCAFI